MKKEPTEGVRIVRKHKKGHGGHHGGAWKVAYADFVTAMMAFFLVMWIVGLSNNIKQAIAAYFQDPVGFMKATEGGTKPLDLGSAGILNTQGNPPKPLENNGTFNKKAEERQRFEKAKYMLDKLIAERPEFKRISDSIRVIIAKEGLRIDLVESKSDLFFDSGSATPKQRTKELLKQIALELGNLPNKVIIEGHTDSRPYRGPNGWSNWELSTARANAARDIMEHGGLENNQMVEVRGLADKMPIDLKHKDSCKNRRVSILLPFSESALSADQRLILDRQTGNAEIKGP
jgi:chemotaxis protein MotB